MTPADGATGRNLSSGQVNRVAMLVGVWLASLSLALPWVDATPGVEDPGPPVRGVWVNAEHFNGYQLTGPGMAMAVLFGTLALLVMTYRVAFVGGTWSLLALFAGSSTLVLVVRVAVSIPSDRLERHAWGPGWWLWPLGVALVALGAACELLVTEYARGAASSRSS